MSRTQPIYRALSIWNTGRAAVKGPAPLARRIVRRESHKTLARVLRKLLGS